jgi:hypothetical protein
MPRNRNWSQPTAPPSPGRRGARSPGAASLASDEPAARHGSSFAARFGKVILSDGIAAIPAALFHYQGTLDLDAHHVWFIANILSHKWDSDLPYPSLNKMAYAAGLHPRTLSRYSKDLCSFGYLQVYRRLTDHRGIDTNAYDFRGLFGRLEELIAADPPARNPIRGDGDPYIPDAQGRDNSFVARYGRVISRYGVAAIPKAIFTLQKGLGLDPQQVWFVCYILSYQWDTALPYPSISRMSRQTGYSKVRLHEIKASLVTAGYLRIVHRHTGDGGLDTNAYDFSPLLEAIRVMLEPAPPAFDSEQGAEASPSARAASEHELPMRRKRRGSHGRVAAPPTGRQTDSRHSNPTDKEHTMVPDGERIWGTDNQHIRDRDYQHTGDSDREFTGVTGSERTTSVKRAPGRVATGALRGEVTDSLHKVEAIHPETINKIDDSTQISRKVKNGKSLSQPEHALKRSEFSPYIAEVITDFSAELGDSQHITANVSQALRLWGRSGLEEQAFVEMLHETRKRVRLYQGKQGLGSINNKMAYFFTTLRDVLSLGPDAACPYGWKLWV